MDGYFVYAIEVSKDVGIWKAKKLARKTMEKKRLYSYKEGEEVYKFKNLPKHKFDEKTFRRFKVDKDLTLICGRLKDENISQEE